MKILILCTGNSCRSQMAHGFLQSFNSNLKVFSAGTNIASEVTKNAIKVMAEIGIDISKHKCTPVEKYLNEEWDFLITVCSGAKQTCPSFAGKVKKRLHIGFDDPSQMLGTKEFIESEFIRVRDEIKTAFFKLYEEEIKSQLEKS